MSANPARKHHYVPAALLGRWADALQAARRPRDRVVRVFHKKSALEKLISTEAMCWQRDLYLLPEYPADAVGRGLTYATLAAGCDIELPACGDAEEYEPYLERIAADPAVRARFPLDLAERSLGRDAEGPFLDLVDRIETGYAPDRHEQAALRRFMALLLARHPSYFEYSLAAARERSTARAMAETAYSGEYAADVLTHPLVLRQREIVDAVFYPMAIASSVAKLIVEWPGIHTQLTLAAAPPGHAFVLSDSPAYPFVVDRSGRPRPERPWPGFTIDRALIALPVSPTSCIVLSRAATADQFSRAVAKPELMSIINTASAMTAMRFVVLPPAGTAPFTTGFDLTRCRPWRRAFLV